MEIRISEPQELVRIVDEVHDKFFDVEALRANLAGSVLTIQVAPKKEDLSGSRGARELLTIRQVKRIEIDDSEKVGFYDINEIEFDAADSCIKITGGIPIELRVFVEKFDMTFFRGQE